MIPALLHSSPIAGVAELPAAGTEFLRQCRPDVRDSGGRAAQFNKSPPDRERVARIVANMRSRLAGIFRQPVLARDSPARQCGPGLGGMKLCGRPGFVCGLCDFLLSVSRMFPRSMWPVYPRLDCARWGAPAGACRQGLPVRTLVSGRGLLRQWQNGGPPAPAWRTEGSRDGKAVADFRGRGGSARACERLRRAGFRKIRPSAGRKKESPALGRSLRRGYRVRGRRNGSRARRACQGVTFLPRS